MKIQVLNAYVLSYGQSIYLRNEPRHDITRDNNLLISKCSSKFVTGIFLYNLVAKQYTSIALLPLIIRKDTGSRFNGILNCQLVTFVCFLNVGMLTSHVFLQGISIAAIIRLLLCVMCTLLVIWADMC